ncbi:fibronectin type III domain-containing protein [bacterium]|nr:fibronectin type III domain-containing protein [bacterium]
MNSCSGSGRDTVPYPQPLGPATRISAQWLREQPGQRIGELSFHLFDAEGRVIEDWKGLRIRTLQDGSASTGDSELGFELQCGSSAPDDVYLYVTYPDQRYSFQSAAQDSVWDGQYLLLSIPHRMRDIVVIGLARTQPYRGVRSPRAADALLSLHFQPGAEPVYRSVTTVNEDPGSVAQLQASPGPGAGEVSLSWEERNLGDYNNNGIVEITDLTPIGLNYQQKVSDSPTPKRLEIIDGSMDGIVNVQDLTRIGANFQRRIEGYNLYRADGLSPAPGDFALRPGSGSPEPSIERAELVAAASPDELKQRLVYIIRDPGSPGSSYSWFVRAWSGDGGNATLGPASNQVSASIPVGNLAPVWDSSVGLVSAVGASGTDGSGALRLSFGRATDPEGTTVTYKLRYLEGLQAIGSPGTISLDIPANAVSGAPPYSYLLEGLTRGSFYRLNLQAEDSDGVREQNSVSLQAKVPMLGFSSDTWANYRGDAARSGSNPACGLREPLGLAWSRAQTPIGDPASMEGALVISADGWTLGMDQTANALQRYALEDGSPTGSAIAAPSLAIPSLNRCLSGSTYGASSSQAQLLDLDSGELKTGSAAVSMIRPLLLGDYLAAGLSWPSAGSNSEGLVNGFLLSDPTQRLQIPTAPQELPNDESLIAATSSGELVIASTVLETLRRGSLLSGSISQTGSNAGQSSQGMPCIDEAAGRVFINSAAGLHACDLSSLSAVSSWPRLGDTSHSQDSDPCLVLAANPRLLLSGGLSQDVPDRLLRLRAIRSDDLSEAWLFSLPTVATELRSVTAGSQRIFVLLDTALLVLDFEGRLRQQLAFASGAEAIRCEAALAANRLLFLRSDAIACLAQVTDTLPGWPQPVQSQMELSADCDSISIDWPSLEDPEGQPLRYTIAYRSGQDPQLEAPFSGTTLIKDVEDSGGGFNTYTINGLAAGERYYIRIAAYNGFFDEDTERSLSDVQRVTTCWDTTTFSLDGGAGELSLPAGEVFAMRGVVEPAAGPLAARMHLVYNDKEDAHLTHLFQDDGLVWQHEGPGLATYEKGAFEPVWDLQNGRLVLGYADQLSVGYINRTGPDTWQATAFFPSDPVANPMLSMAIGPGNGDESALVYTKLVNAGIEPDADYYYLNTSMGSWGTPLELDSANFSGRDLDLLLDPADSTKIWLAEQRGTSYAPNRFTPDRGGLYYASGDGMGGFSFELVDAGANGANSDCGKRVQQELSPGGLRHMAYYDLNADPDIPVGQLKYAFFDGANWQVELVSSFDLSFQDLGGGLVSTYSELGFATCLHEGVEKPMIATLGRTAITLAADEPHFAKVILWIRDAPGVWHFEELSDPLPVFPKDRAPCVLLRGDDGRPNIFVGSGDPDALPLKADWILHFHRAE